MSHENDTLASPEVWCDVPGYEGFYQVSNHGRVKALARLVDHLHWNVNGPPTPSKRRFPERILSPKRGAKSVGGYYKRVQLYRDGTCYMPGVHVLVMLAFASSAPDDHEVNHKDGTPGNDWCGNLEYVTRSANLLHARTLGRGRGEDTHEAKLDEDDVRAIRRYYPTASADYLAELFKVSLSNVWSILSRKTWKHVA